MDLIQMIGSAAARFARQNKSEVLIANDGRYLFVPATPRVLQPMGRTQAIDMLTGKPFVTDGHGLSSVGPSWFGFGLAGEGHERDLMVRAEMVIGAVTKTADLGWYMQRHYMDTSPFYALVPIESVPFLVMIIDTLVPFDVGEESMGNRLGMKFINMNQFDLMPGVDYSEQARMHAVNHHEPYLWPENSSIQILDLRKLSGALP